MTNEQAFAVIEARGWILGPLWSGGFPMWSGGFPLCRIVGWSVYANWSDVGDDLYDDPGSARAIGNAPTIAEAVALALVARRSE